MSVTRRGFLLSGLVGGAALLSGAGAQAGRPPAAEATAPAGYATLPGVRPPGLKARRLGPTGDGLLFLGPFHGTASAGALIVDDTGEPVWIHQSDQLIADVRVQVYDGEPVLTYWEGERRTGGHGAGTGVLLGRDYQRIAEVRTGNGVRADFHEFVLTDRGTALILAYPEVTADMRPIGGPRDGRVNDGRVQEIDVRTGEVLLDWSALDHLDITETRMPVTESTDGTEGKAFDPVHINSIQDDGDTLLLSARNTSALYSIDRRTGAVRWRLGGRRSDFTFGEGAAFAWQHDARRQPDGTITLFDNHIDNPGDGPSRGLVLKVDETERTVNRVREYGDGKTFGQYMGNMQVLPGGNVLIGWGSTAAMTEFSAAGEPALEITGIGNASYRAYRAPWSARPADPPDIAVTPLPDDRMKVHVSWNGATGVAAWRFRTGSESRPVVAKTVRRRGFETAVTLARSPNVIAEALAADGTVLARSEPRAV